MLLGKKRSNVSLSRRNLMTEPNLALHSWMYEFSFFRCSHQFPKDNCRSLQKLHLPGSERLKGVSVGQSAIFADSAQGEWSQVPSVQFEPSLCLIYVLFLIYIVLKNSHGCSASSQRKHCLFACAQEDSVAAATAREEVSKCTVHM